MNNNLNIAKVYAEAMHDLTTDKGVWLSQMQDFLSRSERRSIIKVYTQFWKNVDYNAKTGVVLCSK